jgi:hypothetical protein
MKKISKRKKIGFPILKALHKKAWKLFSAYIRQSEKGICFTCGVSKDWKDMNAGHYIHKDCLDFDPVNIHCQCVRCNKYLSGNLGVYAERLIMEYGEEAIAELRIRSQEIKKFTLAELEEIIFSYQEKLKDLETKG